MASWGNNYPGTSAPIWWHTTSATASTWPTTTIQMGAAPPRERTPVEWLRERVEEMCGLARLEATS